MKCYNFNIIYIYFLKLFLILIKYKFYIYDVTGLTVGPTSKLWTVNHELVTFLVR